jgi:hypothetical protein
MMLKKESGVWHKDFLDIRTESEKTMCLCVYVVKKSEKSSTFAKN